MSAYCTLIQSALPACLLVGQAAKEVSDESKQMLVWVCKYVYVCVFKLTYVSGMSKAIAKRFESNLVLASSNDDASIN